MNLLVAYDSTNTKRRNKIAKTLEAYGVRVNYSVFEVEIPKSKLKELIESLKKNSDPKKDHIRIYQLNKESLANSFVLYGNGEIFEQKERYI